MFQCYLGFGTLLRFRYLLLIVVVCFSKAVIDILQACTGHPEVATTLFKIYAGRQNPSKGQGESDTLTLVDLYWNLSKKLVDIPFASDSIWLPNSPKNLTKDRILEQLIATDAFTRSKSPVPAKRILLLNSFKYWWNFRGAQVEATCPGIFEKCTFLDGPQDYFKKYLNMTLDAVLTAMNNRLRPTEIPVRFNTTRIFYSLESPFNSKASLTRTNDLLATYWSGSDIVKPYDKWVYYNSSITRTVQVRNFALGKTKPVAIFVSNCISSNNRLRYAKLLQKYINVDVYGLCGNMTCAKSSVDEHGCFKKLKRHYKFYLAFENSNCREYITEKLYRNAFRHDTVPVVMGGHMTDYEALAPQNSFIHVDNFDSAKALAEYLHYLDKHHDDYNKYFEWKGTGTFVSTDSDFFCRLCALLHLRKVDPGQRSRPFRWDQTNPELRCLRRNQMHWKNTNYY